VNEPLSRRLRSRILAVALVLGAVGPASAASSVSADLRIVVWPNGRGVGEAKQWTLRCAPTGGSLPNAGQACRRLGSLGDAFAPVAADRICMQIYGGPEVALVRGRYRGRRIWATFKRIDSCQIERWIRVAFLFPGAPATRAR
jgi:hypothetical protein